jgi:hypothetical protein
LGLIAGFAAGALSTVLGYKLRERGQDRRERKRKDEELHGAAQKVLTEVEHNREAGIKLIEEITNPMPLPHDAHEAQRADAWEQVRVRLYHLMPRGDFRELQTYYRERKQLARGLRDYHLPTHYKNDRSVVLERLRLLAGELGDFEQRAINALSKHLGQ